MTTDRPRYDCDTLPYWCSEADYENRERRFGRFIEDGAAYEITDRGTPRPWLNYLCNDRFAACVANDALGFTWYRTSLLRVTKYEHEIDYLPRQFRDGREVLVRDAGGAAEWNVFRQADELRCVHRPGGTTLTARVGELAVEMVLFVPPADAGECWLVTIRNEAPRARTLDVEFRQTWTFAKFGIHTAEEGIPYLSTPGRDLDVEVGPHWLHARSANDELPFPIDGLFLCPQCDRAACLDDVERRKDGRVFTFKLCRLGGTAELAAGEAKRFTVFAGADEDGGRLRALRGRYEDEREFDAQLAAVRAEWGRLLDLPSCRLPVRGLQDFLNVWLKNQLHLTFRFVRSGHVGYRDTLQDTWGYALLEPARARAALLRTLAHVRTDGVCPRNYSVVDDGHDLRAFMDSGTWIAQALVDYVRETGEVSILDEPIRWLDDPAPAPLADHVRRAVDLLYERRGRHGLCLTGDGDWNDALEGISRSGDAVSAWLTMALFHAQNLLAELYAHLGDGDSERRLRDRSAELKRCVNEHAWDGEWYVYGLTGTGRPIGSRTNREGRIHLNAQTWAVFTGIADGERAAKVRRAVAEHLETPLGAALLAPPYVHEGDEVGRIARLEPGTFENGSIYQHAVAFQIFADLAAGHADEAVRTFVRLLPTNPDNFDCRRTGEPYCMGNYYCGPGHPRFGQNFFTWFTGSPAWLLRAGYDRILGVRADFDGLRIDPRVPADWNEFTVRRAFRGAVYHVRFARAAGEAERGIRVDGRPIQGNLIPPRPGGEVDVRVAF